MARTRRAWPHVLALVLLAIFVVSCTPRSSDAQRRGRGARERLREIAQEVEQKRADGYDTALAESLLVQLNGAMKSGNRDAARGIYDRIEESLRNAHRLSSTEAAARNTPRAFGWSARPAGRVGATWPGDVAPLGITGPFDTGTPGETVALLRAIGAGWVRLGAAAGGGIFWGQIETSRGHWSWAHTDSIVAAARDAHVHVLANITPYARWEAEKSGRTRSTYKALPGDLPAYRAYVRAVAERYRGRIHAYQIANEPDHNAFWQDTAENYAALVAETYPVIKAADPSATVLLAGINTEDFLRRVLLALTKRSPGARLADAGDVHVLNFAAPRVSRGAVSTYRETDALVAMFQRAAAGTPYADLPLYVTETSTYDGEPRGLPAQTPVEQARDCVRLLAYPFAFGVRAVFWTSLVEWTNWTGSAAKFNAVGLVENPKNGGRRGYKPAFFAMAKFAEMTRGMTEVRALPTPDWVTALEFTTPRGPVIVAWYDRWAGGAPAQVTVTLPVSAHDLVVTTAVPTVSSASSSRTPAPAFPSRPVTADGGRLTLTLSDDPIYVHGR